ncbi:MAG: hypothetical protein K8L91_30320 [Anaerolineae bacterium]|nr:hypothetical protein [Anaerolineae bacterium]
MLDTALAQVFGFDQSDLTENQQGRLSPKQSKFLKDASKSCMVFSGGFTAVMLAITLILMLGFGVDADSITPLIIFTMVGAGFLIWTWSSRRDVYLLQYVEGAAQLRTDRIEGAQTRHVLNVDGYEFTINGVQYHALNQGVSYKVYYAMLEKYAKYPKTNPKLILSIEHRS